MRSDDSSLIGFSDADWAGDMDNQHSTTGNLFSCLGELLAGLAGNNQLSDSQLLKRSILDSVQPHKRLYG